MQTNKTTDPKVTIPSTETRTISVEQMRRIHLIGGYIPAGVRVVES
jgi:hypothetical protein